MAKAKEISRNDIRSWLSSDLGQTMPEFTNAGSAGYGVSYKPYFVVNKAERVDVGGYINHRSDDYNENVRALQGIGHVTGISYLSAPGQTRAKSAPAQVKAAAPAPIDVPAPTSGGLSKMLPWVAGGAVVVVALWMGFKKAPTSIQGLRRRSSYNW